MAFRSWPVRCFHGLGVCLFVCLIFISPGSRVREAWAGDADKAAARAHYETGTRLYEVREYADALREFKAAYVAKPDPAFLFNIGQCNLKMGKNQEALDFFQQFLKKAPPDNPNRGLVETRIRNLQAGRTSEGETSDGSGASKPAAPLPASSDPNPSPQTTAGPGPRPSVFAPQPQPSLLPPPSAMAPEASTPAGVDVNVNAAPQTPPAATPFYSTWWFWTGVGAVVVGGSVATCLLLSRGGGTSIPNSTLGNRTLP